MQNTEWYSYTTEYYAAHKNDEIIASASVITTCQAHYKHFMGTISLNSNNESMD